MEEGKAAWMRWERKVGCCKMARSSSAARAGSWPETSSARRRMLLLWMALLTTAPRSTHASVRAGSRRGSSREPSARNRLSGRTKAAQGAWSLQRACRTAQGCEISSAIAHSAPSCGL